MALPSEQIKEKLDVVTVLREYLDLRPAGRNFKALCPFHQEKTSSFVVSPERQIWHCFGCNEGGDIFKFLMKYENIEFYEALKILAEKAGVALQRLSPVDQKQFGVLYDINNAIARFWSESLEVYPRPQEYFKSRGLKKETIAEFELGFAPNEFDVSTVHLIKEGFNIEDIVRAGLAFKTEKGKYIDRFRGRIMFPIHNHFGKVVGFSGRILPEFENSEVGKYINSPETPIFNKSKLLYGFFRAKNFIREKKTVLIVEGQMDFLMLWQAGVKNLAATSGTSLTVDHLKVLRKLADNIVVTFDKDEAGAIATERAIDLAHAADFSAFVFDFGEFKDPAEAAEKKPEFIEEASKTPTPAMEYYFKRYLLGKDEAPTKTDIMTLLRKIKNVWSHIEQASWIRELSHRVGLPTKELTEELERLEEGEVNRGFGEQIVVPVQPGKSELTRMDNIILRILSLTSIKEGLHVLAHDQLNLLPLRYRSVYLALNGGGEGELDREAKALFDMLRLRSGLEAEFTEEIVKEELGKLLKELELEHWKEKRRTISREISQAEDNRSNEDLLVKLKEFDDVSKKIHYIDNGEKD